MSDSDLIAYAKISAHSGIDIVFDKNATKVTNEAGEDTYRPAMYEWQKNRITINPESKSGAEQILIHELDHAVRNYFNKDGQRLTKVFNRAFTETDEATQKKIMGKVKEVAAPGEIMKIFGDEVNAYYAERMLTNKNTLKRIVEAEPGLKDKILSFFKGAEADYADVPKLSGSAKWYYKKFKKMFDEFSARNAQSNANEKTLTSMNQENMQVSDRQYAVGIDPVSGEKFVAIEDKSVDDLMNQPGDSIPAKVRSFMKQYRGTVLPLGSTDKAYMRREAEGEYTNLAKVVEEAAYQDKMKAASELTNLLSASKYLRHEPDNGRHADATRGWNYYDIKYVVPNDDGSLHVYSGEIQIKLIDRGDCFYDVTKIKDITNSSAGQALIKAAGSVRNAFVNSIPQTAEKINTSTKKSFENSSDKQYALDIDSEGENISGAEVMGWLNKKPEGDEFNSPTITTVGKERVTYQEKFGSKEWRKTKSESAYIHAVDEMYGIQSYLEKIGKVKNAKSIIQNVRSTPHQAQSMIGSVQYNVFEADKKTAKKMEEGLNEIFRPIEKMGEKAANDFDDYLLHHLNVDKYNVIEKTQKADKDAAESLRKVREEIDSLEDQRNEVEKRIFNLGNSTAEQKLKEGLKKSLDRIDKSISDSRADEIALLGEAPGYAEQELKRVMNEIADLLSEKNRAKAEIFTLGNTEADMKRKSELKERNSHIESKLKRLEESAAAMEEIAKAYKIAIKPVFNLDGANISKQESQKLIREYESKYPEFKKTAQKVWNFNKNLNTMRVSAGLISKRIANRLAVMYPHYVPSFKAKINNNAQGEGGVSVAFCRTFEFKIIYKKICPTLVKTTRKVNRLTY